MKHVFFGIFLILCVGQGHCQTYRNLVLEGGGIRGIAYGGAIAELEQRGLMDSMQRVGGTSAGAIQAALLCVGYSATEITQLTYQMPIRKMNDGRYLVVGGSQRLMKNYGWYRGEAFTQWLKTQLAAKTGNPNLTLGELHQLTPQKGFRDLYVTGTNLSRQRLEVFSYETHPHLKVADAVRISMSIPLYFRAVLMDESGNVVTKPKRNQPVDVLVDGGMLANYPIDLFDKNKYLSQTHAELTDTAYVHNPETLGLRLDRPEQVNYDQSQKGLAPYDIASFRTYMTAFYTLMLESVNRNHLKPEDWQRTISISTLDIGPKIKRVSKEEKEQLMASGQVGVQLFFASRK